MIHFLVLANTKAALALYSAQEEAFGSMMSEANTQADVDAAFAYRDENVKAVQEAFYKDCVAEGIPNSRAHCAAADISFLRGLVAGQPQSRTTK